MFQCSSSETWANMLRIGVKSGGCSGNTYDAILDDNMQEFDDVYYTDDKLRIVSDKISSVHLDGLTIDFSNDFYCFYYYLFNRFLLI